MLIQEVKPKFETNKNTKELDIKTKFAKRRTSSQIVRRSEQLQQKLNTRPSKGEFNTKVARIESIQKQAKPDSTPKHPMIYRPFQNNKKSILQAINAKLLSGIDKQLDREMISQYLDLSSSTQFLLLLNAKLSFLGVYCNDNKGNALKLYGVDSNPLIIDPCQVEKCYKYDTATKSFKDVICDLNKPQLNGIQKEMYTFIGVDAVVMKNKFIQF